VQKEGEETGPEIEPTEITAPAETPEIVEEVLKPIEEDIKDNPPEEEAPESEGEEGIEIKPEIP